MHSKEQLPTDMLVRKAASGAEYGRWNRDGEGTFLDREGQNGGGTHLGGHQDWWRTHPYPNPLRTVSWFYWSYCRLPGCVPAMLLPAIILPLGRLALYPA